MAISGDFDFHRVMKSGLQYLFGRALPAVFGVITILVLTRFLGPESYGRFSLLFSTAVLMSTLLGQWLEQAILRFGPREFSDPTRRNVMLKTVLRQLLILSAAVVLIVSVIFTVYRGFVGKLELLVLASTISLWVVVKVVLAVFRAELDVVSYRRYEALRVAARFFVTLLLLGIWPTALSGLIGLSLSLLIVVGAMFWKLRHEFITALLERSSSTWSWSKRSLAYGVPLVGWYLGFQVLGVSDRYLLGYFWGDWEVGMYSAAYDLVEKGFGLLVGSFLMAFHPIIMREADGASWAHIRRVLLGSERMYLLVATPLLVLAVNMSKEILGIALSDTYIQSYTIVPPLALGFFVWQFSMFCHKGLELEERTRAMCWAITVSAVVNVGLNLLVIPIWKHNGAAYTTLIGYLVYFVVVNFLNRAELQWVLPCRTGIRVGIAGISMVLVSYVLNRIVSGGLWFGLGVQLLSLLMYTVVLLILGEFRISKLKAVWKLVV